jgi:hypothetical protein
MKKKRDLTSQPCPKCGGIMKPLWRPAGYAYPANESVLTPGCKEKLPERLEYTCQICRWEKHEKPLEAGE